MVMVVSMEVMVDTVLATEATAMVVLATDTARGLLTLRPMLTMATEAMVDMVLATEATAMVVLATDTARGQPLRRRRLPLSPLAGLALAMMPRFALSSKRNTRSAVPIQ